MSLFRTKPITSASNSLSSLKRCLTATDLTLMGIGAIIGAGVFVLTGIAAATKAGPAISLSYVLAGLAALFSAFAYAELSSSVGGCGSAYSYAYASFGELIAWILGWALLLEYTVSVSSVAIGWSGYLNDILLSFNIIIPKMFMANPAEGGWINLPAVIMVGIITVLLCTGAKQSARFNAAIVFIKLSAIVLFIAVAAGNLHPENWHPYLPFGAPGIAHGAAIVFFAYIGFDAVSTAAEESINPQRDMPIAIIASVLICTVIYVIVSVLLTGITSYTNLNVSSPVADALILIGYPVVAGLIAVGAIAGLTTVMLVMFYGLTRILFAMSRDGLLPKFVANVNPRTQTPIHIIVVSGVVIALIAGFMPLGEAAALVNIGTLAAFTLVCSGVIFMRWFHPTIDRPFKLRFHPALPLLGILFCVYLMLNLSITTWITFLSWLIIGLIVYFTYSRKHSVLNSK